MLRALIFDVDGTLAETERDGHRIAFNLAFAEAGLDWRWDIAEYGDLLGVAGGLERLRHFMRTESLVPDAARRHELAVELHSSKTRHYRRIVESGAVDLRPGVARLLAEAHREELILAIATTTSRTNIDALFAHTMPHALPWFSVIAAAEQAPRKKPDPQVYRFVLDQLRIDPRECIAFEDSSAGLHAAAAVGIPTLITVNEYTSGQDFDGAMGVLADLGEPGKPARVLAGPALQGRCVDVDQLRTWHRDVARRHADSNTIG